jgi:hypothetical protein
MPQPPQNSGRAGKIAGKNPQIRRGDGKANGKGIPQKTAKEGNDGKIGTQMGKFIVHGSVLQEDKGRRPIAIL